MSDNYTKDKNQKLIAIKENSKKFEEFLKDYSSGKKFSIILRDTRSSNSDTDLALNLIFQGKIVATAGISVGLEDYYPEIIFENNSVDLKKMISRSSSDFVVTLMQSMKAKKSERSALLDLGVDYRIELMNCLEKISSEISPIHFYLPGKFVYWNLSPVREFNLSGSPLESILRKNYDNVAKKFGFKLSSDSNLYER